VGLSLVLGVASTFLDEKDAALQVALVAALAATAVALLIDQYVRFDDVRDGLRSAYTSGNADILRAMKMANPIMRATHSYQELAAGLVDDWRRVEQTKNKLHAQVFEAARREFAKKLHDLAEGRVEIDAESPYGFRRQPMEQFRSMHMVQIRGLAYWDTQPGKKYLDLQSRAIRAGELAVERIFVLDNGDLEAARPVVERHAVAGIAVRIVIRDDVVKDDLRHLVEQGLIIDDNDHKIVIRPVAGGGAGASRFPRELISDQLDDVATAVESISVLRNDYAEDLAAIYPDDGHE
jgi:hypothetical protein